ncbi:alginate O-acetylation protein [Legionella busanensis]|uniref:Probable alginate O-acetylase n=1 Tax=Legionella busanensis TaxID=190655 RepID=A0A378JJ47_9GAMM|nr:MBOAT family O-acyltransferase [Legionella busanensis]STX50230.1 alginate O-acetylation protein [Legionella busanensis]
MVFSSLIFLFLFLPSVNLSYFLFLKRIRIQNLILALSSLVFYYWGEKDHIFIMLACIIINYLCGILINDSQDKKYRKFYLITSIVASLSLLIYFKYFNFFISTANQFLNLNITNFGKIALPLGISFYTFHSLSYVIDVYWKKFPAERNFINFVGYVSLFPQLVAGPIVRYCDIRHSFYRRYITLAGFRNGILRFCFGLGKKVLIANEVGRIADIVFNLPTMDLTFGIAWLGAIAYTLQIYFDFSGYSDMAIGIGLMFGFRYKENFRFPYNALSIQEFWRKWHISLSSWFRDYVYIPLGGNRKSKMRTYLNLLLVFGLCGFWHGASYTFIFWGLFHGLFLVLERTSFGVFLSHLPKFLRHAYVLVIVTIGWVFFREEQIGQAFSFLKVMFFTNDLSLTVIEESLNQMLMLIYFIGALLAFGTTEKIKDFLVAKQYKKWIVSYRQLSIFMALIILFIATLSLSNNSYNPFLYFKF